MAVNATPARDQIGADQVARAIRRLRLSVPDGVLDLSIATDVAY